MDGRRVTNRQRLCLALIAYIFILAMGGGALFVLVRLTDNRGFNTGTNK